MNTIVQSENQQHNQYVNTLTKPSHISNDSMDSSYCSTNIFDYKSSHNQHQQQQQQQQQHNDILSDNVPLQAKPKSTG